MHPAQTLFALLLTVVAACGDGQRSSPRGESSRPTANATENATEHATPEERTIAFGEGWGCARTDEGAIACWMVGGAFEALTIRGTANVRSFAVGAGLFAILEDKTLWHWEFDGRAHPIEGSRRMVSVDALGPNVCALDEDGRAYCWGEERAPRMDEPVRGVPPLAEVEAGFTACGRDRDGAVWCWGSNHVGQLGDGTTDDRDAPVRVQLPSAAIDLDVGDYSACAVLRDGTLYCWGSPIGVDASALGCSDRYEERSTDPAHVWFCPIPYRVPGMTDLAAVDLGGDSAVGTRRDGAVLIWPANVDDDLVALHEARSLRGIAVRSFGGTVLCGWRGDRQVACVQRPFGVQPQFGGQRPTESWVVRLPPPNDASDMDTAVPPRWTLRCPAALETVEDLERNATAEQLPDGRIRVRILRSANDALISERVVAGPVAWQTQAGATCGAMGVAGASLAAGGGVVVELSTGDECSEDVLCARVEMPDADR